MLPQAIGIWQRDSQPRASGKGGGCSLPHSLASKDICGIATYVSRLGLQRRAAGPASHFEQRMTLRLRLEASLPPCRENHDQGYREYDGCERC
jgi:hypothetical protein